MINCDAYSKGKRIWQNLRTLNEINFVDLFACSFNGTFSKGIAVLQSTKISSPSIHLLCNIHYISPCIENCVMKTEMNQRTILKGKLIRILVDRRDGGTGTKIPFK